MTAENDILEAADPAFARGGELAARLASFRGPAWRKAYLARLLESGRDLLRAGQARSGGHCLDKVEAALHEAGEGSPVGDRNAEATPRPSPRRALDDVRSRWREERFRKASEVLERHGRRLTGLERRVYRETLDKWTRSSQVTPELSAPSRSGFENRADAALLELRRRLYGRILKTQKADLVRRSGRRKVAPRVEEVHAGRPIGPYNDRQNLEGVLALLSEADPAWVEEFLELYRGLAGLQVLSAALQSPKK